MFIDFIMMMKKIYVKIFARGGNPKKDENIKIVECGSLTFSAITWFVFYECSFSVHTLVLSCLNFNTNS